jgi:proteasome accessory factor C
VSTAGEQLARLLALVPWLRARPGVRSQDAADHFGITLDQLEADLNLLIVCGLPGGQHGDLFDIEFWPADEDDDAGSALGSGNADAASTSGDSGLVPLGPTIRVLDAVRLDRPMRLRPDEAAGLLVGLRLLQELPGGFDRDRLDRLVARLTDLAGDAAAAGAVEIQAAEPVDTGVMAAIDTALRDGRRLAIRYLVPSRDEVTERDVDPERDAYVDGHRYLVAWCRSVGARRHFRVDRILSATVLPDATEHHTAEPIDADQRVAYRPSPTDLRVRLHLTAAARWIDEYAVVEAITEHPDGGATIELASASLDWIVQLVLRAGGAATVLDPPEVVAAVIDGARAAAGLPGA